MLSSWEEIFVDLRFPHYNVITGRKLLAAVFSFVPEIAGTREPGDLGTTITNAASL